MLIPNAGEIHTNNKEEKFKSFFRVSRKMFDYIFSLVKPNSSSKALFIIVTVEGRVLRIKNQVAIALSRLDSSESQHNVGESFDLWKLRNSFVVAFKFLMTCIIEAL